MKLLRTLLVSVVFGAPASPGIIVDEGGCGVDVSFRSSGHSPAEPARLTVSLEHPCYLLLRLVGPGRDTPLATLLDREYTRAGTHSVFWNGCDSSGNHVWTRYVDYELIATPRYPYRPRDSCAYTRLGPNRRPDFVVDIVSPRPWATLRDTLTVEAVAREGFRGMGDALGYTVTWILDDIHVIDHAERLELPHTKRTFGLRDWPPGDHQLRVVYRDDHKHVGSASVPVFVEH